MNRSEDIVLNDPRIRTAKNFRKSYKKYKNNSQVIDSLNAIIKLLLENEPLPEKYCDHELIGRFKGIRELHLQPDTLLLYFTLTEDGILKLYDIGSHSDIFK